MSIFTTAADPAGPSIVSAHATVNDPWQGIQAHFSGAW